MGPTHDIVNVNAARVLVLMGTCGVYLRVISLGSHKCFSRSGQAWGRCHRVESPEKHTCLAGSAWTECIPTLPWWFDMLTFFKTAKFSESPKYIKKIRLTYSSPFKFKLVSLQMLYLMILYVTSAADHHFKCNSWKGRRCMLGIDT